MLKEYFTFSNNQKYAIIAILILIIICWGLYFYIPLYFNEQTKVDSTKLYELALQIKSTDNNSELTETNNSRLTPYPFDPNTLDSLGFAKMGLRPKMIHTILNYRNKGGKFYSNEDVKKMYGLRYDEYKQLEPYIQLHSIKNNYERFPKQDKSLNIELNSADTSKLIQLNGIGPKLSVNIIKYREQLGGFYSVNQLSEVWGISTETFNKIKNQLWVDKKHIKKINLNEITYNELNLHPYFKGNLCKEIIELRKKKGYHFENIEEIKEIGLINDEIFRKIAPYLIVN